MDELKPTNIEVQQLVQRIWRRAYLDSEEEHARWINKYAAKRPASLCREKIKRAIEIARINMEVKVPYTGNYTEQEILEKLKL